MFHQTCKAYSLNPATEFGIDDIWLRFQFNNAVALYGRWIQNGLDEVDDKGKHVNTLSDVLGKIGTNANSPQQMSAQLVFSGKEVLDF